MQGKIIKGIAGFYYVYVEKKGIYECKAKGKFRNKSIKPLVGDNVMVDIIDEEKKKELERKLAQIENELSQKDTDAYRRQNAVTNNAG